MLPSSSISRLLLTVSVPAATSSNVDVDALRMQIEQMQAQLAAQKAQLDAQNAQLEAQKAQLDKLEARLRKRRTEPEDYLRLRLHAARLEMNEVEKFDYRIVNEDDCLDETADLIYAIIRSEKARVKPRNVAL